VALATYYWEWESGEAELRRAVELSPGDPYTLGVFGQQLCGKRRFDEALPLLERSLGVGPMDLFWRNSYAQCLHYARKEDRAVEEWLAILEVDPGYIYALAELAFAYMDLGRDEESYEMLLRANRLIRDEEWLRGWERGYEEAGLHGALRHWLRAEPNSVLPLLQARLSMELGEVDMTFELLERAYEARAGLPDIANQRAFDPLRSDPRFQDLLRRIGFPEN
jgi:tetratricopeptide (TPR) repeat protein